MLHDGLYEQIINKGLETELSTTDKLSTTVPIDSAEASKVLAKYIAEVVEKGLDNVADNGGDVSSQVALANRIISTSSCSHSLTKRTAFYPSMKRQRLFAPKHLLHKARYLPVQSMSRRCLPSSRRKLYPVTVLICLYPSLMERTALNNG